MVTSKERLQRKGFSQMKLEEEQALFMVNQLPNKSCMRYQSEDTWTKPKNRLMSSILHNRNLGMFMYLALMLQKYIFVPHEHCIYSTLINAKNNANVIYVGQTWLLNTCRVFRLPSVAFSMPGRILKRIFSKG